MSEESNHHTDKILIVALTGMVLVAAIWTNEPKLQDGFLIALGASINYIGSRLGRKSE